MTLRVIQVGIGGMGDVWLRTVRDSSTVEFAGFVEVNADIARAQAEKHGLDRSRIFGTLDEALRTVKADAVIDVTPPEFHRPVAFTAFDAGLPVLAEKPLSDRYADAEAIAGRSEQRGVLHMVAQNYRYGLALQTLKQTLAEPELGDIGAISVNYFKGPHFTGFRNEMRNPLVMDMAIHHFDLMRFLLDREPVSIYGRSWNPPWSWIKGDAAASLIIGFEGGVTVTYDGSWCASGQETTWNGDWRIDCAGGVVTLVDDQVYIQRWQGVDGFSNVYGERQMVTPAQPALIGQAYLLQEFYEAITTGKPPATRCQDNLYSLSLVFGALRSFDTGSSVPLPLTP